MVMRFSLFTRFGALNSPPVFDAVRVGLQRLGHTVLEHDWNADVAVIWSVLWNGRMAPNHAVFEEFRRLGRPVIVVEVGCLDRGRLWRLSVFHPKQSYPREIFPSRWQDLNLSYHHRTQRGENVLIVCQRTDSLQWNGQPDITTWLTQTVERVRLFTDRPIVIRPHPRQILQGSIMGTAIQQPQKLIHTYDSFDFDRTLGNARVVINHNASPSITAVLGGVPVITGLDGVTRSLAHEVSVGFDEIETDRIGPGTESWLNKIAHTEWAIDEIKEGTPLAILERVTKS